MNARVAVLLVALPFAGLHGLALAQDSADWIADARTGCRLARSTAQTLLEPNSLPAPPPANLAVEWSGSCKDGYADGDGLALWRYAGREMARSEGTFRRGRLDGTATNGGYTGQWREGKRDGTGVQHFPSRRASDLIGYRDGPPRFRPGVYDGEWKGDRPEGRGSYTLPDSGPTLSGVWRNGCFDDGAERIALLTTRESCGFR